MSLISKVDVDGSGGGGGGGVGDTGHQIFLLQNNNIIERVVQTSIGKGQR